eukprot:TRINITY_DN5314_c1_g1_i6.p1 TRINITY_DN5314_c1_g1~~TRINITY_DN5314_c1_g1_i6.p1  ORF type:complete len:101 (-),score=14.22 TRINITY_DN5314_c1_g1_i6:91-393(-)
MCLQAYKTCLYGRHVFAGLQGGSVWTSCVCRLTIHVCMDVMYLQAYKVGLYGRRIVWVLIGWYDIHWWKKTDDSITCSPEQMEKAVEGYFAVGIFYFNPK